MTETDISQDTTALRVKLDSLSQAFKKLANSFTYTDSNLAVNLVEPQIINRLLGLASWLESLKSLAGNEGEIFASLLKNAADIIQNIGNLFRNQTGQNQEEYGKILKAIKNLENQIKELLPLIASTDEERKKSDYETFGGLLQKLIDTLQEKRHLILRDSK